MADALTYQLKLIDAMSGPAKQADSAIGELAAQMKRATDLTKTLSKEQAAAAKIVVSQQIAAEKQLAKEQAAAAKAEANAVAKAAKEVEKAQKQAQNKALAAQKKFEKQRIAEAEKAAAEYKKAQENSGGALDFLKDKLGALLNPEVLAAAAATALGAAFMGLVIGGAALAIHAAEAKQDTLDLLDAMLGSQAAAKDVYGRIETLTGEVAISQERATGLARELSTAGITQADALTKAIKTIGQVESVLGSEAGGKIQNILEKASQSGKFELNSKQLVGTGIQVQKLYEQIAKNTHKGVKQVEAELKAGKISAQVGIEALTQVVGDKFAGPAAGQVQGFGNQIQRLKDNVSRLFEDVDTAPFLSGLKDVLSVFDQSTDSGKALKQIVTSAFDAIFKAGAAVLPYIKASLKGLVIIGLQIAIAFKPMVKAIKDAFGGDSASGVDSFASALSTVGSVLGTVVGWVVKLATNTAFLEGLKLTFYAIGIAVGVLAAGVALLLAPMYALGAAIVYIIGLGAELIDWASTAGSAIVDGLVQGVLNGGAAFAKTITELAHQGLASFKAVFGIHSPSKVMAQMGKHMMAGLDMGINLGAPAANDTLAAAVDPAPQVSRANTNASSTVTHNAGGVTINITISGVGSASELEEMMPAIMADALEQAGLMTGASQAA